METKYYLDLKPLEDGSYCIHSGECPLLPSPERRIFIGTFLSPKAAEMAARKYYRNIGFCRFCLKEFYKKQECLVPYSLIRKVDFIKSAMIVCRVDSMLVCGNN
jgi:hypothetical protein